MEENQTKKRLNRRLQMSSYKQFLILLIIMGYFLAKILDSLAVVYLNNPSILYLDYILFGVAVLIIFSNRNKIKIYLKERN